jgi:hypothetical protein
MNALSQRCVKAGALFLLIGISLGVLFAFNRAIGARLRPLHAVLNLWGWVTLLIYAMGYHMLPRFAGRPLASPRLANWQSWLAIGGVALSSAGWLAQVYAPPPAGQILLAGGGLLQLVAAQIAVGQRH